MNSTLRHHQLLPHIGPGSTKRSFNDYFVTRVERAVLGILLELPTVEVRWSRIEMYGVREYVPGFTLP